VRSLGGEAFGDERCAQRRTRGISRRRASFFLDLGVQPGLSRRGRALLLCMIVGETAGLEDYRTQLGDAAATDVYFCTLSRLSRYDIAVYLDYRNYQSPLWCNDHQRHKRLKCPKPLSPTSPSAP
jgi:hypothetical protein